MSTLHQGYYQRSFADGTPPVLFHISETGQEWRWSVLDQTWVPLDGTAVAERVMDADPWTDRTTLPESVPAPPG